MTRVREGHVLLGIAVVAVALRLVYLFHYRVDSDEPQHLHVVWAWTQGLIPYRDFFDNHTPLFHILCIPIFRAVGERADIMVFMRLFVFPLYLLTVGLTYVIARTVSSPRAARWATLFAALTPYLFLVMLEFRTDDLWTLLWVAAVAVVVSKPLSFWRVFVTGFLLGADLATSMKTILLVFVLIVAATITWFLMQREGQALPRRTVFRWTAAGLAGFFIVPSALLLFFARQHALGPLVYCTILHNIVPGAKHDYLRMLLIVPTVWLCIRATRWARRGCDSASAAGGRIVVICASILYVGVLASFWPTIENQDYPPCVPFLAILAAQFIFSRQEPRQPHNGGVNTRRWMSASRVGYAVLAALLGVNLLWQAPWENRFQNEVALLTDVLRLTGPGDFIADNKGETVFRRRSTYYVLEKMTKMRFREGLLPDDIAERIIATHTCVALPSSNFPRRTRTFLAHNFLDIGRVYVAGEVLRWESKPDAKPITFNVAIPARYDVVAESGPVKGILDGAALSGSRYLTPGPHTFLPQPAAAHAVLIWAEAIARHYSPFPLRGLFTYD